MGGGGALEESRVHFLIHMDISLLSCISGENPDLPFDAKQMGNELVKHF